MDTVKMRRNCLGDTRTATHMPTREEFREANWSHKDDVLNLAVAFATELRSRVGNHDWTKVQAPYDEMFYDLMKVTIEDGADFMDGEWARLHYDVLERHHLSRHCPNDVTLFDVLEMLFDCVSAGMTRSGSVYPIDISDEILQKAVSNTVDYLVKHIEVVDRNTEPSGYKMKPLEQTESRDLAQDLATGKESILSIAIKGKMERRGKQTDRMTEEGFDTMLAKVLVGQTESTGSPIGDYRDGVGAWQTDCGWGKPE